MRGRDGGGGGGGGEMYISTGTAPAPSGDADCFKPQTPAENKLHSEPFDLRLRKGDFSFAII